MIPRQADAFPSARRSRSRPGELPEPDERRRLRERWGLSTRQVATAFGVTPATVRSWEHGRSAPRGSRKEAYRRFLAGLASYAEVARSGAADRDRRRTADVQRPLFRPAAAVPAVPQGIPPGPSCPNTSWTGRAVRAAAGKPGADPVSPERIRRLRRLGAAACVWSLALWVIITCPPPL
ncbi:hypothetical protein DEJ50_07805 [Streptomyces venezuelae]|uniref:HTH cro/C1-type domain-containing protein n=1 Tax=Streptomyces venezuelae TaxID=54571 RepID=A0A5P2DAW6_STRVZ|nr:hypothetical protein DEJ50_07805 [Streptomyces venezuelae]